MIEQPQFFFLFGALVDKCDVAVTFPALQDSEIPTTVIFFTCSQKIESEGAELEHLRKVLDVKEDLEKKQIEAINQLNNRVKKQEIEITKSKSESEDYEEKIRSMQVTLDNSYK